MSNPFKPPADLYEAHPGERLRSMPSAAWHVMDPVLRVVEAEEAAALSLLHLENLHREHERALERLNRARADLGLVPADFRAPRPAPVAEPTAEVQPPKQHKQHITFVGRVTHTDWLTNSARTNGTLTLACGSPIRWVGRAPYVDALEELFSGIPVVMGGETRADGLFGLNQICYATRNDWNVEDAADDHGRMAVQELYNRVTRQKKQLAKEFGWVCIHCACELAGAAESSLAEPADGPALLLCRPCKVRWSQGSSSMLRTVV
ncbi:hypothetical protein [Streptomyces sp. NPDC059076]|uniref:hypothetical protein n=1 Tax=unclassified Streptomyces TaxID=2593676 RepID=UPI0036937CAD